MGKLLHLAGTLISDYWRTKSKYILNAAKYFFHGTEMKTTIL